MKRPDPGFTLLELLIVIAILGLLAFIATPPFLRYLSTSKTETVRIQIQSLGASLDLYGYENGRFPTTQEGLKALHDKPASAPHWKGPYLKHAEMTADPWGHPYHYRMPGRHGPYDLYSGGGDGGDPGENAPKELRNW